VKAYLFLILMLLTARVSRGAEQITIAAASDLTFALRDIAGRFEKESGQSVRMSFGSSGNFYSQIVNGAPFDLFFSADLEYPKRLEASGLAEPGSFYRYATGRLVLWLRADSKIDVNSGLGVLLDPSIHKIAIANPAHAPYGRAAEAALKKADIYARVANKLVLGENISQAAHFVESGNADAGLLALSLALAPAMTSAGSYYVVPENMYPPIDQGCVILKSSHQKTAAWEFLKFLKRPEIVDLMKQYGFLVPGPDVGR
jgi:molybdate transport system substrate-binding protein